MELLRRAREALKTYAPLVSMVATLSLAAWLYVPGGARGRIIGFAQAETEAIASVELARIVAVHVDVDGQIAPGQIVATLDATGLDVEIAVAEAEQARLTAMISGEQARMEERITVDLEDLRRQLAKAREEHREASAEEQALRGEISRVKRLVEDRQASLSELTPLDMRRATIQAIVEEKPRTIELLRAQIAAAEGRHKRARDPANAAAAQVAADLALARQEIESLKHKRAGYVLRANRGGRVIAIDKRPGEIAVAGEPILRLVSTRGRVVACVQENAAVDVRQGDAARLWVRGQTGAPLTGRIVALGPLVAELPVRCRSAPTVPVWGRDVTIALDHPVELLAGQAFDVTFTPSSAPPAAAPSAPGAPAGPLPMSVPPALLARSRFEPSGIVPRAGEGRYILVSDDTGRGDGDEHRPWLFAMSEGGAVDPEPLPITGVSEVNDLESIAAGDAGEMYVLASQSYSAKGKRKPSRTLFLRLRPEGRGFRVDAEVHLAELLEAAGTVAMAELGLPAGTRALEIEGMAFRDGALYFGLKAPLDAQGNAIIWKLSAQRALFNMGGSAVAVAEKPLSLEAVGLSIWARVRMDVEVNGAPVPGGISELLFLPDGSLAVASTPSTAEGAAGSLYRVDRPEAGSLSPRLIRRFPGLKPEGLAPSLSPGKLVVVFDAGAEAPSFLELPW
jgi:multidrug resistance efflux pump